MLTARALEEDAASRTRLEALRHEHEQASCAANTYRRLQTSRDRNPITGHGLESVSSSGPPDWGTAAFDDVPESSEAASVSSKAKANAAGRPKSTFARKDEEALADIYEKIEM